MFTILALVLAIQPVPDFVPVATPAVNVPLTETGCNVSITVPASTGWSVVGIARDFVGRECPRTENALRWGHDWDAGRRIVLIIQGVHRSGDSRRAAVTITMASGS